MTQTSKIDSLFNKLLKESPLYTRLKVYLEMQHLTLMIQPDRCCTDEEANDACKWAHETTMYLLDKIKEWEEDGAPVLPPSLRKESDSLTTPEGEQ